MRVLSVAVVACAATFFACTAPAPAWPTHVASDARKAAAASTSTGSPAAGTSASGGTHATGTAAGGTAAPAPYDKFVEGAEITDGLFPLVKKDGKLYLKLTSAQLGVDFYEHATTVNGLGGYGVLSGDDFDQPARIVRFVRTNDAHVAVVLPQFRFAATPGTPQANAVDTSTADSVMALAPIVAEDRATGSLLIDPAFLLGDTLDIGNRLSDMAEESGNPKGGYALDAMRSYFGPAKAFPKNDVIEADETFASSKPDTIATVADAHSIQMRVKYNFAVVFASPDYMPRLADDRVGYFSEGHVDFDTDERFDNVDQYVLRWNLKASDPSRPSPAVKSIVFTLTNTIPVAYRPAIRDGILAWNRAFERIGILNAVQVQDQPTEAGWDPDDIRYNTVRWLTEANGGGFAEAQFEWNPRTGEIFRGGILIDSDIMRFGKFEYADLVGPSSGSPTSDDPFGGATPELWDPSTIATLVPNRHRTRTYTHRDVGAAGMARLGALALAIGGQEVPATYAADFLRSIVLHETGHDFGLQHNFISQNAYSASDLKNRAFTAQNGVATSVMAYSPVNLWPKNSAHGDYFQTVLGPYDYYAIHWGYTPVAGANAPHDETSQLDRWAGSSADPKYAFASDEDVEFDGHAVDPRIAQWTLTNDNISWCRTQFGIDRDLIHSLDVRYPRPQMPWDQERSAFMMLTSVYSRCTNVMTHYIAGEHISRARRGDANAPPPLTPVARDDEMRAFRSLDEFLFSDGAWQISPQTLRRTTYTEYGAFSAFNDASAPRHDISLAALVGTYQNRALGYMFSPLVLQRLADLPSKAGPTRTMSMADLFTWTQASAYGDLQNGAPKTSMLHHNLQRSYARLLERLSNAPPPGTPYDAQALARHELVALQGSIRNCLHRRGLDLETQAHLEALGEEVGRSLDSKDVHQLHV
jgi:hypothetical protein